MLAVWLPWFAKCFVELCQDRDYISVANANYSLWYSRSKLPAAYQQRNAVWDRNMDFWTVQRREENNSHKLTVILLAWKEHPFLQESAAKEGDGLTCNQSTEYLKPRKEEEEAETLPRLEEA